MQTILIVSISFNLFCIIGLVFLMQKEKKRQDELKRLEKELQVVQLMSQLKEKEINAIRSIVKAQSKEGLKAVKNLHQDLDNVLDEIKKFLGVLEEKDANTFYHKIENLISEAYEILRHGFQHRKNALDSKQGFVKALKFTAKQISESENITIKVHDKNLNQRFENDLELMLYRITQELINNSIQHAKALEINIRIWVENELLYIAVEDNGRGFDASEVPDNNAGIGLKVIQRHIGNLKGKMNIDSRVGVGTIVTLKLPLKNKLTPAT